MTNGISKPFGLDLTVIINPCMKFHEADLYDSYDQVSLTDHGWTGWVIVVTTVKVCLLSVNFTMGLK